MTRDLSYVAFPVFSVAKYAFLSHEMSNSSIQLGRLDLLALSNHTYQSQQFVILMQTEGLMFPLNRPRPSTPRPLAPKMIQLRFGANSPGPSPFYSPSANSVQHLR